MHRTGRARPGVKEAFQADTPDIHTPQPVVRHSVYRQAPQQLIIKIVQEKEQ
jgi:hypothetical protein